MTQKTILITGASGYIGSHTSIELLNAGFEVIGLDNLCNSKRETIDRIEEITSKKMRFYEIDIRNSDALHELFALNHIDAVIHFAGLKAVGQSMQYPLAYFDNNVCGTTTLLNSLSEVNIKKFIFSSSATVYGNPSELPIKETARLNTTNPYGRSKLIVENILADLAQSDSVWRIGILRYFNPVGAHPSGLIGENPNGTPNNLMPFIAQVAVGLRERLTIFGNDYDTPDGTGVRDYVHVVDLAKGHVAALNRLFSHEGQFTVNLGTGKGHSVLETVKAFEKASKRKIPFEIQARRPGDIAQCYSSPESAYYLLGWQAKKNINEMCADHWRWQEMSSDNI